MKRLVVGAVLAWLLPLSIVTGDPGTSDFEGTLGNGGAVGRIGSNEAANLPAAPAAAGGAGAVAASSGPQPRYEYRFASACERAAGTMGDTNCTWALLACPVGGGPGPLTDIFRRTVLGTTPVTGWSQGDARDCDAAGGECDAGGVEDVLSGRLVGGGVRAG
jgi:hypothetical protein